MKNSSLLTLLFLLLVVSAKAQLTGMTPNQGVHGQTLPTTITGNGIFIQSSSPSGNIYQMRLLDGANSIMIFDLWSTGWWTTNVVDPDTVTAEVVIPISAVPGLYDLEVITGDVMFPWTNQTTYTLPDAFTILPPDGYINGTLYDDLNRDGIKDAGEPGLPNRQVKLLPMNWILTTNASGDFSFPVANGTYDLVVQGYYNPFLVVSSNDTLTVTINNNTSNGNDFGLMDALYNITPVTGYQGVTTVHQLVSDAPIFTTGAQPYGNVSQFRVLSNPTIYVNVNASVTVIDNYTIQVAITVPIGTTPASNIDLYVYVSGAYNGYHYLDNMFNIAVPPAFVSGTMFFDINQNKLLDVNEPGINNARVDLAPDNSIAFTDSAGEFTLGSLGGQQTLTPTIPPGLTLFTDSATYTFNATGTVTGKDFGFLSTLPDYTVLVKDLYILPRCNTQQYFTYKIRNTSNVTYDVIAWVKKDPLLTFISSPITPTSISNDTIYWNITGILPYSEITISALFLLPPAGNIITIVAGANSLDGTGAPQLSNQLTYFRTVICAMDPNDKQVTPAGIMLPNYTLMTDTLEYFIRFQNTGNDTAFNVVVLDTLDAELDFNTFTVLGSSHSMQTELESNGAIRFNFENIMLVDSVANEPESHGWIKYTVVPQTGLPDTTVINNTAHIFFDFNAAVVTNTTLNTLLYVLPVGINEVDDNGGVIIQPNPFNESAVLTFNNPGGDMFTFTIYGIAGNKIAPEQKTKGSQFNINRNKMADGIYFYQLVNNQTQKISTGKFIIN